MNPRITARKLFAVAAIALAALLFAGVPVTPYSQAQAATPNYAVGTGVDVVVIPLHISGQYTATTVAVARFTLPFKAQLIGVSASARASGGTTPTLTVDVLEAAVSVLSTPVAVTAGAVSEATITDANLADESAITVNLAITGTSPTWNDIVVFITVVRTS